jgi:hypothetical protein
MFKVKPEEIKPLIGKCIGLGVEGAKSMCERIARIDGTPMKTPPTEETLDQFRCAAYINPEIKWHVGNCPLATHVVARAVDNNLAKHRVGQQKQKKKK